MKETSECAAGNETDFHRDSDKNRVIEEMFLAKDHLSWPEIIKGDKASIGVLRSQSFAL